MDRDKDPNNSLTKIEEKVLEFWDKNKIFERSLSRKKKEFLSKIFGIKRKKFIFYDGPPFATGTPHYGHILASAVKDAIPRYKTMNGYSVPRKWGWDCHGLPLEVEMEKKIGINSKKDIEKYGIEKFNGKIKETIFLYEKEWNQTITRIGRWVDMKNDYKTMSTPYIESVWSIFKKLYKKGYVSNDFKVLHYCPRCATVISKAEVSDSYEELNDISVYVAFPLKEDKNTSFVAWTTTSWTLFGNFALGIDKDLYYIICKKGEKKYILLESKKDILGDVEIIGKEKGSYFVGKEYIPPFEYMSDQIKNFKVIDVDFIDTKVGTGIVHIAPAYGEDDMRVARKKGLPIIHHVTKDGKFIDKLEEFKDLKPKEKGNPKDVDKKIIDKLIKKDILVKQEDITHSYSVCWRCNTPIINYASKSWLVHTKNFRHKMISENKTVKWIPEHIRDGRFENWLSDSKDWAISRSRFWGAPIPVWQVKKTGENIIVGSIEEMLSMMKAKNKYIFLRHGESESNILKIYDSSIDSKYKLTAKGLKESKNLASQINKEKNIVLFSSPLLRARETAQEIKQQLNVEINIDDRLIEKQNSERNGKKLDFISSVKNRETKKDVYIRLLNFLNEVDEKYENKTIIIVTHEVLIKAAQLLYKHHDFGEKTKKMFNKLGRIDYATPYFISYKNIKRDQNGEIDVHRPYIDDVVLYDKNDNPAYYVREVFDCWFESGSMPYGSNMYPYNDKKLFDPEKNIGFPADFISEGMDQTRGWFYSLIANGVGAFGKVPFKNVIATGIIRSKDGKKMSKSLKNYTDPIKIVNTYGADSLRHYLLSSSAVRGQDLDFKDEGVEEIYKKVYLRLNNCVTFYTTYAHLRHKKGKKSLLDKYILSRLGEVIHDMTDGFEKYKMDSAVKPIINFVEDLSTWYLRRSRDILRKDDKEGENARDTFRFVLNEFAKCIAPIAPFYSEYLYSEMRKYSPSKIIPDSVHLCEWPKTLKIDKKVLDIMNDVKSIVSMAHVVRSQNNLKVRQPLQKITIKKNLPIEAFQIIKDEINIKEVVIDNKMNKEIELDLTLTDELKEEGFIRECIRNIQKVRKAKGFSITEQLNLMYIYADVDFLNKYEEKIKKEVRVDNIIYSKKGEGDKFVISDIEITILLFEQPGKVFN